MKIQLINKINHIHSEDEDFQAKSLEMRHFFVQCVHQNPARCKSGHKIEGLPHRLQCVWLSH